MAATGVVTIESKGSLTKSKQNGQKKQWDKFISKNDDPIPVRKDYNKNDSSPFLTEEERRFELVEYLNPRLSQLYKKTLEKTSASPAGSPQSLSKVEEKKEESEEMSPIVDESRPKVNIAQSTRKKKQKAKQEKHKPKPKPKPKVQDKTVEAEALTIEKVQKELGGFNRKLKGAAGKILEESKKGFKVPTKAKPQYFKDSQNEKYDNYANEIKRNDVYSSNDSKVVIPSNIDHDLEKSIYLEEMETKKEEISLKITAEQNRQLFGKVRASQYRTMSNSPRISNPNKSPLKKEQKHTHKLQKNVLRMENILGPQALSQLRELFVKYAGLSSPLSLGSLKTHNFKKFMTENNLYTEDCNQAQVEIWFKKDNQTNEIDFGRFCEILYDMGVKNNPSISNPNFAVYQFLRSTLFTRNNVNFITQSSKYADWFIELENDGVVQFLEGKDERKLLLEYFTKHKSNEYNSAGMITMQTFINFCKDTKIIPQYLTNAECAQLFQYSQRPEGVANHPQLLEYNEFVEAVCFLGFYFYTKPENIEGPMTYLDKIKSVISWIRK